MRQSLKQLDYKNINKLNLLKACLVIILLTYFFYKSFWGLIPMIIVGILYYKNELKKERALKAGKLSLQFKECLLSVHNSLNAGYAVENAFIESKKDMEIFFGEQSDICKALDYIRRGLIINIPLEELLINIAKESGCREIQDFAEIFIVQKKNGGNLNNLVKVNVELIDKRIELRQEVETVLSGKGFELSIMRFIPFLMMSYISFTYKGYFDILYFNIRGVAIMTLCLIIYVIGFYVGERVVDNIFSEVV